MSSGAHGMIPVIDLFAGPGGLGEGFSSVKDHLGKAIFKLGVSIEKDPYAHATLQLRAAQRHLPTPKSRTAYLDLLAGRIDYTTFCGIPAVAESISEAGDEAKLAELGKTDPKVVDGWISRALHGSNEWVLIGGPPCQAYSLAGRSRRRNDANFEADEKHFLYKEYLRILSRFEPAVFVMENVKGLLSASHGGNSMFMKMIGELGRAAGRNSYDIRSFVSSPDLGGYVPADYVIRSENYGVPQTRHRVILLGVRSDYRQKNSPLLDPVEKPATFAEALSGIPEARGRLSGDDTFAGWLSAIRQTGQLLSGWKSPARSAVQESLAMSLERALRFHKADVLKSKRKKAAGNLLKWLEGDAEGIISLHEPRSHMAADLQRYFFLTNYAKVTGNSLKLQELPEKLMPDHANARLENPPNQDRFRVQLPGRPASTVVSHIAKDGHYYIHPDPAQCRSLTVREAARLQTFPDSYLFLGPRTAQFAQVGNAVPPYLARQLGSAVATLLGKNPVT